MTYGNYLRYRSFKGAKEIMKGKDEYKDESLQINKNTYHYEKKVNKRIIMCKKR